MRLYFSNPLDLGKTGAGRPYGYIHQYLKKQHDEKNLELFYINGMELVKNLYGASKFDPQSLGQAAIADNVASFESLRERCDVFLGAGCASLDQMREIMFVHSNRTNLITTWFSSHYAFARRVLEEEYQKWGIKADPPIDPYLAWRDLWEQRYSDCIVVPSQACAETYEADEACKGKVRIANFGVDCNLFHPWEQKPEEFRVMFAGGNWIRKGLLYLIQAWNELNFSDGVLTAVGCSDPGIRAHRTNYTNWIPDELVPEYYRRSSVFVLPSLEEGQALAGLEAMASGIPVIATPETGLPIDNGVDGILVKSRDVEALKLAIQFAHDHPQWVEGAGKKAREKAETLTWEKFGARVLEICQEFHPSIHNQVAQSEWIKTA